MSPDEPAGAARLQLALRSVANPRPVVDLGLPGGNPVALPVLRLIANFQVVNPTTGRASKLETGLIETGADLSVIEHRMWNGFLPGMVEPVPFADGTDLAEVHIGGGTLRYRLGRVWVRVISFKPRGVLPPVPVLARLLGPARNKAAALVTAYPFILGLHRGILDGRRLTRVPVPPQPTDLRGNAGPEFGQRWFLEDPAGLQPL